MIYVRLCLILSLFYLIYGKLYYVSEKAEFKKALKSHSNILVFFCENQNSCKAHQKIMDELADASNKIAKLLQVNCEESKKLCKQQKVKPKEIKILHYNKGSFNKEYDRKLRIVSLMRFLEDPTGDIPWEEDDEAKHVVHVKRSDDLQKLATKYKDKLPSLILMFYAPWCGYCKQMKPIFAQLATEMKSQGKHLFVGINGDTGTNEELKSAFNVTGYPSIFYIQDGNKVFKYENQLTKEAFKSFVINPQQPPKEPEKAWSDETNEIDFLTDENFEEYIIKYESVLVMFYAPWCGHCKSMKPHVLEAVRKLKLNDIPGKIAAMDSTEQKNISKTFKIEGFPTLKYFKNGQYQFDISERTTEGLVNFMKDPQKPPEPEKTTSWKEENSAVLHPTAAEFKSVLKRHKHILVMYYAPWCGYCKQTKPEFTKAANAISTQDPPLFKTAMAAVDCTESDEISALCQKEQVQGYPTIRYYSYGKSVPNIEFNLERNTDDFIAFLTNPANPKRDARRHWLHIPGNEAVSILESDTFVQGIVDKGGASLVMFYAPWCGHCKTMKPAFVGAAKSLQKTQPTTLLAAVDSTQETNLSSQYKVEGFPTLIYFSPTGEWSKYTGGRSEKEIVDFMVMKEQERIKDEMKKIEEENERKRKAEEEELERKRKEEEELAKKRKEEEKRHEEEEAERRRNEEEQREKKRKEEEAEQRRMEEEEEAERRRKEEEEAERRRKEEEQREKKRKEEEAEQRRMEEEEEENRRKKEEEKEEIRKALEAEKRRMEEELLQKTRKEEEERTLKDEKEKEEFLKNQETNQKSGYQSTKEDEEKIDEKIDESLKLSEEKNKQLSKDKQKLFEEDRKYRQDNNVVLVDKDNIENINDLIILRQNVAIYFYKSSTNKGRNNLENSIKKYDNDFKIIGFSINCDKLINLCDSLNIVNFPQIQFYHNGGFIGSYDSNNWSEDKLNNIISDLYRDKLHDEL